MRSVFLVSLAAVFALSALYFDQPQRSHAEDATKFTADSSSGDSVFKLARVAKKKVAKTKVAKKKVAKKKVKKKAAAKKKTAKKKAAKKKTAKKKAARRR